VTASIDEVLVGTLGEANIGLAAGLGLINPLAAQLDAFIAFGIGPLQSDLSAQFDASLSLQASLALTLTDPTARIRAALQAVIELTAALSAALSLPPTILDVSLELGASAAFSAALTAKLGAIQLLLEAAISVKIPAIRLAAELSAAISAGSIVLLAFDGFSDPTNMQTIGSLINTKFSSAVGSPPTPGALPGGTIQPTDNVAGIIMLAESPSVFASLGAIIQL